MGTKARPLKRHRVACDALVNGATYCDTRYGLTVGPEEHGSRHVLRYEGEKVAEYLHDNDSYTVHCTATPGADTARLYNAIMQAIKLTPQFYMKEGQLWYGDDYSRDVTGETFMNLTSHREREDGHTES